MENTNKEIGINPKFWQMQGMAEKISENEYQCKICRAMFDINSTVSWIRHRREENIELTKQYIIIPPDEWDCKIHLMGCVERGIGSNIRRSAHAHNQKSSSNFKWLCFKSCKPSVLGEIQQTQMGDKIIIKIIKSSKLLRHEYAHLLAPNQYHNNTFKRRENELKHLSKNITI